MVTKPGKYKVKDTENIRYYNKNAIGKIVTIEQFQLDFMRKYGQTTLEYNKYGINFRITDFEPVNKFTW